MPLSIYKYVLIGRLDYGLLDWIVIGMLGIIIVKNQFNELFDFQYVSCLMILTKKGMYQLDEKECWICFEGWFKLGFF